VKSTRSLVIERWLKRGDYAINHGEGLDFYQMWARAEGSWPGMLERESLRCLGRVEMRNKIVERRAGIVQIIELNVRPWTTNQRPQSVGSAGNHAEVGSNLNRIQSTIRATSRASLPSALALGSAMRKMAEAMLDRKHGLVSYWQPPDHENGVIAARCWSIRLRWSVFCRPIIITCATRVAPGKPFVYLRGSGLV